MKKSFLTIVFVLIGNILISQSIESKFQFVIDSIFNKNPKSVGIMVHIESPDKNISWSGAIGYSDIKTKSKLEPDQPALIASSIKTFVSTAILRLVEDEKLSIDDACEKYLTNKTKILFYNDGYDLSSIKIKHLLSHTSGIEDYANDDYIDHINKNPKYRWTRDEQLQLAVKVGDPLGKPGEQFSYADANYLMLTEIIETITKKPFYVSMRELLKYSDIGINDIWFPTLEQKPIKTKELVHQYWQKHNWDSYDLDVSIDLYGGGGIACTTEALAKFTHNLFNGNIVENDSVRNLIFTYIKTKETESNPYYLGLGEETHHNLKGYGHGGFWGTTMLHFPDINTTISVFILEKEERKLRKDVIHSISKLILNI